MVDVRELARETKLDSAEERALWVDRDLGNSVEADPPRLDTRITDEWKPEDTAGVPGIDDAELACAEWDPDASFDIDNKLEAWAEELAIGGPDVDAPREDTDGETGCMIDVRELGCGMMLDRA